MRILIQLFKNLSRRERQMFLASFLVFIIAFIFLAINFIERRTNLVPVAGGEYTEGIIGQPAFINPILPAGNDADRDLIKVLFSDVLDLAENYKMSENGKSWDIRLKENIFWHDDEPLTSDDVIFTIKSIQDSNSHSPLSPMWQGITAERVSEREIKLILPEPYAFFESTLQELRPIPKHLFGEIPVANFHLSAYNFEPVGSGPFKFISFKKERSGFITEFDLGRNENYSDQKPYLEKLIFKFYSDENGLIKAFNSGDIDGLGGLNPKNLSKIKISYQTFEIRMPRYYAIFFNPYANQALKDKNVRLALDEAIDKKSLIKEVFDGQALLVNGPLVAGMTGYAPEIYPEANFSSEKAGQILEASGWQFNNEGIREKASADNKEWQRLEFNLIVPEVPALVKAANLIQADWLRIGVKLNLIIRSPEEINNDIIKTRNYEMIFFGNIFTSSGTPDLSSFWHSTERFYPGLNLALYDNKTTDTLIEAIRRDLDSSRRERNLASLQSLIIQDLPAIFLFSPNYLYITNSSLKGFDEKFIPLASGRFENIEKWYVKTAKVFK